MCPRPQTGNGQSHDKVRQRESGAVRKVPVLSVHSSVELEGQCTSVTLITRKGFPSILLVSSIKYFSRSRELSSPKTNKWNVPSTTQLSDVSHFLTYVTVRVAPPDSPSKPGRDPLVFRTRLLVFVCGDSSVHKNRHWKLVSFPS